MKTKQLNISEVRMKIEKSTGLSIAELKSKYNEDKLFQVGLYHVTTTKKVICEALSIPVEGACRYKRNLEKNGLLVESVDEVVCSYTNNPAHLITTNPSEFEGIRKTNQLNIFGV